MKFISAIFLVLPANFLRTTISRWIPLIVILIIAMGAAVAIASSYNVASTPSLTGTSSSSSSTFMTAQGQKRDSLVWVFKNYSSSLQSIYNNPGSITIVSPTLYSTNSTTGQFVAGNSSFNELIETSIINHGLQVWPRIGPVSDGGITNMLGCAEYQQQFIQAAMSVATFSLDGKIYSINGYNIDFEPSSNIHSGSEYTAQAEDNLTSIARKCGVSWQSIAQANNITSQYYNTYPGESLIMPSSTPISVEFDQFVSSFAQALHKKNMTLSVDVATRNMLAAEAPNNGGVFYDYAGLARSADYVVDMDYVSSFCYTSQHVTILANSPFCQSYAKINPNGREGSTFYDQYLLTSQFVPKSKIMIGLESLPCESDYGEGSNCLAGEEISFLVNSGISGIGIWPTSNFLSALGWNPTPYPTSDDWYALSMAFVQGAGPQISQQSVSTSSTVASAGEP